MDFQPPHSYHMGGVWESMIGITRHILDAILLDYGSRSLTHEVFTTFLTEASSIINSRIVVSVSAGPENPHVLSLSTLLTLINQCYGYHVITKSCNAEWAVVYTVEGSLRLVIQFFWKRWKTEYICTWTPTDAPGMESTTKKSVTWRCAVSLR